MPVRIYALAKDLGLDSKDLADLCAKAGIPGKGSALASLDDDEVQRVKAYLAHKSPSPALAPAPPQAPVRTAPANAPRVPQAIPVIPSITTPRVKAPLAQKPTEPVVPTPAVEVASAPEAATKPVPSVAPRVPGKMTGGKVPVIKAVSKSAPAPTNPPIRRGERTSDRGERRDGNAPQSFVAPPAVPVRPPAEPSRPSEPPEQQRPAATQRPSAPVRPSAPQRPSEPQRTYEPQRSPLSAAGRASHNRDLGNGGSSGPAGAKQPPRKPRQPVINLASMPEVKQPAPTTQQAPSQKPDFKLTKDLITGSKAGKRAPLEQLVQQQQDQSKGIAPKGKGPASTTAAPGRDKGKSTGRRGRDVVPEAEEGGGRKTLAGMASARADRGKGRKAQDDDIQKTLSRLDEDRKGSSKWTLTRKGNNTAAPRKEKVTVELPCSVRQFSEAAGISAGQVLKTLMGMGMMITINQQLDLNTGELIAAELGLDIEIRKPQTLEDGLITEIEDREDDSEELVTRPPIVTFLGHVDHGKTSLIDRLIGTRIVAGEAGGITQQIRSYQVEKDGRKITFVDTPGHEAFTDMRARGANVTDIAVLVIAADDGIMPQTEEAISHIKAAGVPIVVALNKVDLPGVDLNRPLTQLTEYQLTPSEWGGDVEVVRTSALTGQGMDELLETLLTVAEIHEYKANPNRPALGVCIESQQLGDKGVVAKLVIKNGTLRLGDIIVCGSAYGRIRSMTDPLTNAPVAEAPPSTPVNITGLDEAPGAGDRFHVLDEIAAAREIADVRSASNRSQFLSGSTTKVSFENFQQLLADGKLGQASERARLNLIVRADTRGSLEAIAKELAKLDHPEVEIRILQRSVGGITLADVTLASASDAVILGFNVIPDEIARSLADERGVEIRRYDIIYKMADEVKSLVEGRLKPEERVVELGRALVKQTFQISRVGVIAGCYVIQGAIERGCRIRISRDGRTLGDYPLETLRRVKDDVKEVPRGMECGIKISGFNDIKQDDVLEAYRIEEFARRLE